MDSSVEAGKVRFAVAVIESKLNKDFEFAVIYSKLNNNFESKRFDKGVPFASIDKGIDKRVHFCRH